MKKNLIIAFVILLSLLSSCRMSAGREIIHEKDDAGRWLIDGHIEQDATAPGDANVGSDVQTIGCLINNIPVAAGERNPADNCQGCDPQTSTTSWSSLDNVVCSDDGLVCTDDKCISGQCIHSPQVGKCLINGACYADNEQIGASVCSICKSSLSVSSATANDGAPCDDGNSVTLMDICLNNECLGFVPRSHTSVASDAYMAKLEYIAPAQATWATIVPNKTTNSSGKAIELAGANSASNTLAVSGIPQGISNRVIFSVYKDTHGYYGGNDSAGLYYHDGTSWKSQPSLHNDFCVGYDAPSGGYGKFCYLGGPLWSIEIPTTGGTTQTVFYFSSADPQTGYNYIQRCATSNQAASLSCTKNYMSPQSAGLLNFWGTQATLSTPNVTWAVGYNSSSTANGGKWIYYNYGSGNSWDASVAQGCADNSTTNACPGANKNIFIRDIQGTGASDVWAVGDGGLIIRYTGTAWAMVSVPTLIAPDASAYNFKGVFSSGDLIFIVGQRINTNTNYELISLIYNSLLDKWFTPQVAYSFIPSDTTRYSWKFLDVGGKDVSQLYIVGSSADWSSGTMYPLSLYRGK